MRKHIKHVCFVLMAVFVSAGIISCSGSDTTEKITLQKGKFSYSIMDSSRLSLVEGQMIVEAVKYDEQLKQHIVTGNYTISKMTDDTSYIAFSSMQSGGEFKGFYDNTKKTININTNPRIADANVFINAFVKSSSMEGSWYYTSFRGTNKEGGLFTANKIN